MSAPYSLLVFIILYAAPALFIAGFIYRVILWARSPVPFHIPTVCGQQKSLSWIRSHKTESPFSRSGVILRMALEVLLFRSLFRNDRAELTGRQTVLFRGSRYLWLGGLLFHWSLLIIVLRHMRFFFEPVPALVLQLHYLDGLFQVALPTLLFTDVLVVVSLTYLVLRRVLSPQIRCISLFADYFAPLLILGIAVSGILMRHWFKVDLSEAKRFTMGMLSLNPVVPNGMGIIFYIHLFLVSLLLAYFPFSKLMHMGGLFMSPTRNLANDSRARRHINPWDYPVKVRSYEEWEEEFRDAIKEAGFPLDKEKG